ncbi:Phosphatidylinositol-4-phosphate 5-kinase [Neurospora sp. IMI 360204]|nr:Phosphatidylinositol-4-phosphate 5-kinase [Neurospora sp. IMI 360204]
MPLRPVNRGDGRTVENGTPTPPAHQTPNGYFPSSPPAQQRDLAPNSPSSPHRYSSPPLYNPAAPISASTSALAPPPGPGIKHRHTLEVPRPSAPRGSKDGVDAAYATGRFSPTGVAGVRRASLNLARRNTQSLHSEMPRDEVVPDDDALRWAEVYREKRASKRRRKDAEDDDRVLVGTKVDEKHANWVTAYNMLTGIRVSVSRTNAKLDRPLTDADFEAKQKSTFDIAGNELVPSAKYDFKFKDYAPWVFRHLRTRFGLDPADYLMSLTGKYILSELGSPGKSGSFFYFSRDYKYIIKTIHHAEHKFLRKILKDYFKHVTENPNTLLSQFYGLHRVKMPYGKKIHFVVMNNLFPPHRDIHETFDLKGSTIGRDYREEDLDKNPRATLKDLNWLRRHRHLELGLQKKKMFLEQLQKDIRLLQKLQIMDYSLLVGIHDLQRGNEENLRDKTLRIFNPGGDNSREDPSSVLMRTPSKLENARKARELRQMVKSERPVPMGETSNRMPDELEHNQSRIGFVFNQDDGGFRATHEDNTPADEIYYLGVIDCLTHYGIIKKMEHFWKGLSGDRHQISALPPHEYGERFINFISGITMSCEEAIREAQERGAQMEAEAALADQQQVPPVPPLPSGVQSPEAEATMQRAEREAYKTGVSEENVPTKTLRTTLSPGSIERRDNIASQASILPVVEEAAEGRSSTEQHVRNSRVSDLAGESEYRPHTPAKDGEERQAGFGNSLLRGHARDYRDHGPPPPTPPKTGYGYGTPQSLKDGADSGYSIGLMNGNSNGKSVDLKSSSASLRSNKSGHRIIGRESLDKALPPLPLGDAQTRPQGVS